MGEYDFRFSKEEEKELRDVLNKLYLLEDSTLYECEPISNAINELQKLNFNS